MFVADNIPKPQVARNMSGEIAHIHTTSEFSVHVVLAPADCKFIHLILFIQVYLSVCVIHFGLYVYLQSYI